MVPDEVRSLLLVKASLTDSLTRTHHGIYDAVLVKDEEQDEDRHKDLKKDKFTFTECIIALVIALTLVSMHAEFLVNEIEWIVEHKGVSDAFMGLVSALRAILFHITYDLIPDPRTFGRKGRRAFDRDR